jgi:hypothetical protein
MFDGKDACSYLRTDLPAGLRAERAGIFEQAAKRERAAQQVKDGPKMNTHVCHQILMFGLIAQWIEHPPS